MPETIPFDIIMNILKMRPRDSQLKSPTAALVKAEISNEDWIDVNTVTHQVRKASNFQMARQMILLHWHRFDVLVNAHRCQYDSVLTQAQLQTLLLQLRNMSMQEICRIVNHNTKYFEHIRKA